MLSAIAAEMAGHEYVYCIICDTDLSKSMVAEYASMSRIIYFASGTVSSQRLLSYGVPERNILIQFPYWRIAGWPQSEYFENHLIVVLRISIPMEHFIIVQAYCKCLLILVKSWNSHRRQEEMYHNYLCSGSAGAQKEIGRQITRVLLKK